MIVVIGSQKGGVGKSTLAANLVVMRSAAGRKVLLVDADRQKSITQWAQQRELSEIPTNWTTIQLTGATVGSQIKRLAESYDDIIVDVGGHDTASQRSALFAADILLLPFQPRSFDIWTMGFLKSMLEEIKENNEKLKIYALINRGDSQGKDNEDSLSFLQEYRIFTCLPFIITQRKAFSNAVGAGKSVIEMESSDKKAIAEMQALYDFIYKN